MHTSVSFAAIWVARLLGAWALQFAAGAAIAQSAPSAQTPATGNQPTSPSSTVSGVTVAAKTPAVTQSIDRRSYDITKDLRANSGTVADALGAVPSISVDARGNVSIRGDSNVVIMIDGKPSTQFEGPGGLQALQALPADQYSRVEVITNPSAAMAPDGTGGIINLVTKKANSDGVNGTVRVNADPTGRWNAQASASEKTEKLSISLSGGIRHDLFANALSEANQAVAEPGIPAVNTFQTAQTTTGRNSWNLRGALTYDPNPATSLSLSGHYTSLDNRSEQRSLTQGDDASGDLNELLDRFGQSDFRRGDGGVEGGWKQSFGRQNGDLSVDVQVNRTSLNISAPYADLSETSTVPEVFDNQLTTRALTLTDVQADYERPVAPHGKLSLGYEFKLQGDDQSNLGFVGAATPAGPFDRAETDSFRFDRDINALFATYEQEIGKLSAQLGLRFERSDIRLDDQEADLTASSDDSHLYPTIHVAYALTPDQQLTASYGERVQRPLPYQYDPYKIIASPFATYAGAASLQPQYTKTFEVGWDEKRGPAYFRIGGYYKINNGVVDQTVNNIGDDAFLYTWRNLINSDNAGGEFEARGDISRSLSYSLSGTLSWNHIDASMIGLVTARSMFTEDGHATLTWQPTTADTVQLLLRGSGRELTAEGYETPWGSASLSYRHRFNDSLSAFVSAEDVFASDRYGYVYITPLLTNFENINPRSRVVFVGLAWSFGTATKQPVPLASDEDSSGH